MTDPAAAIEKSRSAAEAAKVWPDVVKQPFSPSIQLVVSFPGKELITDGEELSSDDAVTRPELRLVRARAEEEDDNNYTVVEVDPDAPDPNKVRWITRTCADDTWRALKPEYIAAHLPQLPALHRLQSEGHKRRRRRDREWRQGCVRRCLVILIFSSIRSRVLSSTLPTQAWWSSNIASPRHLLVLIATFFSSTSSPTPTMRAWCRF